MHGTIYFTILYQGKPKTKRKIDVHGFVDSSWVSDLNYRWPTNIYVFKLFGGVVSWMSRRQSIVLPSTTKANYMDATHESKGAIWLHRVCSNIGFK